MLKKIVLLSSFLILSACTTSPEGVSSEQFAENAKVTKGYNSVEVVGEKIRPINITEKNGLVVMKADSSLVLKIGEAQTSTLLINLQFIDNYQRYNFATINETTQKIKSRKKSVRQCDDQCSVTQYMILEVATEDVFEARSKGLLFSINSNEKSTDFMFKLPANYIDGLFKRYEAEGNVSSKKSNIVETSIEQTKAVEMSQYWFSKLDEQEQILFSTWAIKASKNKTAIDEGSKELDKLHYWYQEATLQEQQKLRVWSVENMK